MNSRPIPVETGIPCGVLAEGGIEGIAGSNASEPG
jgi:hypothetical protein